MATENTAPKAKGRFASLFGGKSKSSAVEPAPESAPSVKAPAAKTPAPKTPAKAAAKPAEKPAAKAADNTRDHAVSG
ncbi:MAG: hypothetical protein RR905_01805, partial [Aurantimicrobium sp.]